MTLAVSADLGTAEFSLVAVVVAALLLVVNGFFTATEIGLLAVRPGRIEQALEGGDRRASAALAALADLRTSFSATQLGATMSSLGLGVVAEPALAALIRRWLEPIQLPQGATLLIAATVALAVMMFLHMVVGDMAPKNLAIARADAVVLRVARLFRLFVVVFKPLILLLNAASLVVLRILRVTPVDTHQLVHSAEDLALVVTDAQHRGTIPSEDAEVLAAALRLGSLSAQVAMTPRSDVAAVPATASIEEIEAASCAQGHTRLVVYDAHLDDVVGMVHVKDVIAEEHGPGGPANAGTLLRPLMAVPASRSLDRLLRDMLDDAQHAALVLDEHGATAGLITLEDVLEELVGEIVDEFDDETAPVASERRWVVAGTMRRDEVARLTGLELDGINETVSGWMVEQLGRLLSPGDQCVSAGWRLTVLGLEGRRAHRIEIVAPALAHGADPDDG